MSLGDITSCHHRTPFTKPMISALPPHRRPPCAALVQRPRSPRPAGVRELCQRPDTLLAIPHREGQGLAHESNYHIWTRELKRPRARGSPGGSA